MNLFATTKQPTVRELYDLHKEEWLKIHFDEIAKASQYKLEWAHTDSNGRSYSRFTRPDLPIERVGKMQDYIDLMSSGLSREELRELISAAENELSKAMAGQKSSPAVIGWTFKQILDRSEMILHTELLYNFLAVQYIRDDEPINEWVEKIHLEKVAQFKEDNKGSSTYFFFQVPELKMVNELLKFSESEWNEYWNESQKIQGELKMKIDHLASVKSSSSGTKTKKPT